jgi:hypothetical protein
LLNIELDVEKRLQADVLKDRIRIKQFFIDFDRLRKGYVGEAGVQQDYSFNSLVQDLSRNPKFQIHGGRKSITDLEV